MLQIFPLLYYLILISSLFISLDIIKKEVSYISIPFYFLVLIVLLLFKNNQVTKIAFTIINLTVLFSFTNALMRLLYILFSNENVDPPLQTYVEWQLILSFTISLVICILFFRKYYKTIKRSSSIVLISGVLLILLIDVLCF